MEFPGKGGRKPLLDLSSSIISLDRNNPRLIPYLPKAEDASQSDLVRVLYEHFDSENVGLSLVQNGYFDEEPIVVIPDKKPKDFDPNAYDNVDDLAEKYKELIEAGEITFTVVEGNRRLSAIKLISNKALRDELKLDKIFPKTNDEYILYDITNIPSIIYPKREDVYTYLGIRHIAGNLKWEAFAQASYTADMIDFYVKQDKSVSEAIKEVQQIIAHRSDKLVKQYVAFKLYEQANEDLDFDTKPIINKFSLLTVAYNSGAIRDYVGLPKYKDVNFGQDLVPDDKLEEFRNILTWIYGDKSRNKNRVLSDSRKITSELSYVVKHEEAVEYLMQYEDLDGAYERTSGEKEFLLKKIRNATRAIKSSLQYAYKYRNEEQLLDEVELLKEAIEVLEKNIH
ncbi:hypothetical protein CLV84_3928 [Neolewinella xylanilytica]|uniref:ParB/Sulfiredoxin domain-containing protein n=1 Tax=Neolewinella xylanilytica TaxID=1514080 RepID=A0A2S6I1C3_9BACT|nr:hypothetical protein [Neolewinella xylanilytica]PPK84764.1 hypothetical protein CLV84_3928 [Neolewinella xylanilytica]